MPGLSSLNKILKAVRDGDISPSYARKAKRAIGKKPKQTRPKEFNKKKSKKDKTKRINKEIY
tara:strand:- start:2461 stop:2646 length:186 start_codon:yes stop_codon:yes gene_type:complete